MKWKHCLIAGSILLGLNEFSTAQSLDYVKSIGGSLKELSTDMAVDNNGNFLTVGSFEGTVDFDPGITTVNLSSSGSSNLSDIFMAKYNKSGSLIWAKSIGGNSADKVSQVELDILGNFYLIGTYNDSADLDPSANTLTVNAKVPDEHFIAKYDQSGSLIWARTFEYSHGMTVKDMKLDTKGNIFLSGQFEDSVDFQPIPSVFNKKYTRTILATDGFLAKYSNTGVNLWVLEIESDRENSVESICIRDTNQIYIGGAFEDAVDFDPGLGMVIDTSTFPSYRSDAFVAKYDGSANYLDSWRFGSVYEDKVSKLKIKNGSFYLSGIFSTGTNFALNWGNYEVDPDSIEFIRDMFIGKYDMSLNVDWVAGIRAAIGIGYGIQNTDFDVDASNFVYTTGMFNPFIEVFRMDSAVKVTNYALDDIFVAKFDDQGNNVWAKAIKSASNNWSTSIYCGNVSDFYLFGHYRSVTDFDLSTGTHIVGTSSTNGNIFLSHYNYCTLFDTVIYANFCKGSSYTFPDGTSTTTSAIHKSELITASGCDSTITTVLYRRSVSDLSISVQLNFVVSNNSKASAYQWINCINKIAIPGATGQSYQPLLNGTYAVVVTENSCSDTSDCIDVNWLGIQDLGNEISFELFPNPTNHLLNIKADRVIKNATIELIDALGKNVFLTEDIDLQNYTIDLANFTPGIYYVKIHSSSLHFRRVVLVSP